MSRIGKLPIKLPAGVEVTVANQLVTVKGKLGKLTQQMDDSVILNIENDEVVLERASDSIDHKAKHGLYRSLLSNMVKGVSEGFHTVQELVGDRKSVV